MTPAFRFDIGSGTHVGRVRQRNEDAFLTKPDLGVWAVADGMGGHEAGDRASKAVVDALASVGRAASAPDLLSRVQDRLMVAHDELRALANQRRSDLIGATVVTLLVHDRFYACVWSGDSRLYRLRGRHLSQISTDHSEVQELIAQGILSVEEGRSWAGRNAITRAVGVHDELEVEVLHGDVRSGDTFLMCSDGLTNHVYDEEIQAVLLASPPETAAERLIHLALERGGEDNITVVVVRCRERTQREPTVIHARGAMS